MQPFISSDMDSRAAKQVNTASNRLLRWRELELRRQAKMNEKKYKVQIFYEKTLPADIDLSKASPVERHYANNSKLGKAYELRQDVVPKQRSITMEKSPTRLQENNIWLWKNEDKMTQYLQARGHKTVRPRDGLRLTNLRKVNEIHPHVSNLNIKSIPTYEDLRGSSTSKTERFRQRSLSLNGTQFVRTEIAEDDETFRERSKSFSDSHGFRRPVLTASTFSRPASDSELSTAEEHVSKCLNLVNTETDKCIERLTEKKPVVSSQSRTIPSITISRAVDDP